MSPTEFTIRTFAADQRFSQALKQDNIPEMRAALAEKTGLIEVCFAAPRDYADVALGGGAHAG